MNSSPASNSIPAWQIERAEILHRACLSLQSAIGNGSKVSHALRRIARLHNGREFKCGPARQMKLSAITLRRAWNTWRTGGERPSAFRLQYSNNVPKITAPVLVRFVDYCARSPQSSLKAAWVRFVKHGGCSGRGRRAGKPHKFSYNLLCRYFRASDFYLIRAHLKTIQAEQTKLAQLRFTVAAGIRNRLPDHLPLQRHKRGTDFQI